MEIFLVICAIILFAIAIDTTEEVREEQRNNYDE